MSPKAEDSTEHVSKKPRIKKPRISKYSSLPTRSECGSHKHRGIFDGTVEVKVGPKKKSFLMHKTLLCNVAPYFRAAFEGKFAEAEAHVLELPEDDASVFEHFQLWVYSDQVLEKGETVKTVSWSILIELYIFGEIRGIPDLQNAVIHMIIDKHDIEGYIPIACIPRMYQYLPENSPLKRLLVDWAAQLGALDMWFPDENKPYFHSEFLMELAVALYHIKKAHMPAFDFHAVPKDYYIGSNGSTSAAQ